MKNQAVQQLSKARKALWIGAASILLIPFIAMQFTDEVAWKLADFLVFGGFLTAGILTYEAATLKNRPSSYKIAIRLAIFSAILMMWMNGAVGIIGNESNDANLMFFGVLLVAFLGSLISRFKPKGMSLTMVVTAGAQLLVFAVAWIAGWGFTGPITLFFVAMWLISARLFHHSTSQSPQPE